MSCVTSSALEFSRTFAPVFFLVLGHDSGSEIRVAHVSKHRDLRVRITLDGTIQESLESTLDAGVHTWREPFSL